MDGIPEMECEATIVSELKIFKALSELADHIPSFIYKDEKGISISYFFEMKSVKSQRNLDLFSREFECRAYGDSYFIVSEEGTMPSIAIYGKLLSIPSVVVNYKYLKDGVHHIIFNFSKKDLENFSLFIMELKENTPGFSIVYLGENRGISRVLDIMKEVPSFYYSSMRIHLAPEEMQGIMKHKWVRRMRYNSPHVVTDAIYKFEDQIPEIEGINILSEKNKVAQLKTRGPKLRETIDYLEPVRMECQKNDGETMYFDAVVLSSFYGEYLKNVIDDARKLNISDVTIRKAGPLIDFLGFS